MDIAKTSIDKAMLRLNVQKRVTIPIRVTAGFIIDA